MHNHAIQQEFPGLVAACRRVFNVASIAAGMLLVAGLPGGERAALAEEFVVVGAGMASELRGDEFEFAVAAAVGRDDSGNEVSGGLLHVRFAEDDDGVASAIGELVSAHLIPRHDTTPVVLLEFLADVKLRNGRFFPGASVNAAFADGSVRFIADLGDRFAVSDATVFSGGHQIGTQLSFVPTVMSVAMGAGTDPSDEIGADFQSAAAIGPRGEAIGRLSYLATRNDGEVVRVDGVAGMASLEPGRGYDAVDFQNMFLAHVPPIPHQIVATGFAAVDVFRADGTSPETCFGDFRFAAEHGPHGIFVIEMPDCREPLRGIENTDFGSGGVTAAAMAWPPMHPSDVRARN